MRRRCRIGLAMVSLCLIVSAFGADAAGPEYRDPLGRFIVAIQPGWSLNPVYPDSFTVEFLKARDRFRVRTTIPSRGDALAEIQSYLQGEKAGAEAKTDPDGTAWAAYSTAGRNVMVRVICREDAVFTLIYTSPAAIARSVFDSLTGSFRPLDDGLPHPDAGLWERALPELHRDPRGRFTFSHPPFWVLTVLNSTRGDGTYTTRFDELGGLGHIRVSVYPGIMGDLHRHMLGWIDALQVDPQFPGMKAMGEPQLTSLGGVPAALGSAEYGTEGSARSLRLMLATHKGTNYSVMLDYCSEGAALVDSRLWGLMKSLRF